jgi:hypothetical protein
VEIVLQSLGDLAGRKNGSGKLGRVTNARTTKGRAMLAAVK